MDHEVMRRISSPRREEKIAMCERVIRLASLVSVEPVLFPISVQHEEILMYDLLRRLMPLIQADFIRVVGYGMNPRANLEIRRTQFSRDKSIFDPLFSTRQDNLVEEFGSSWVEKQGSTTQEITKWWVKNVPNFESDVASILHGGQFPRDKAIDALIEVPYLLDGRPLLADVVLEAVKPMKKGVWTDSYEFEARANLGILLTREWAKAYSNSLSATVFRDLGNGVPEIPHFAPIEFPSISARQAQVLLLELGIFQAIKSLPMNIFAEIMDAHRVERSYLSNELTLALLGSRDSSFARWASVITHYRKLKRRRSFWAGFIPSRSGVGHLSGEVGRMARTLAQSLDCYAVAVNAASENWGNVMDGEGRSFNISNVSGDVNLSQDSSTINTFRVTPESMSSRIIEAVGSPEAAQNFIVWLQENADRISLGDVSPALIESRIDESTLTEEKKSLLRDMGRRLATSATSSPVIESVVQIISNITA
ncbi:hypothetical protein [Nocardiopsis sp. NRRL B-16309]|uniref:hypothetical protein n=1 Tax=Nocardiopsis sp. NRRL B-16309 TaxID=1519494 RepID=UPI0012E2726D|nr:hypothetical protein [Nocardiopsis sp. NRRL B-16309]